ncbi:MAG: flavin reductase [Geminicoccaceae bacterium]|nr:MAG: flavin reductase [Geminicoccaceae bacterium]
MAQPAAKTSLTPDAAPAADLRAYRQALGNFATGITVVTTVTTKGMPIGLTVNSFTSVSLDPPLVSWCLGKNALSLEVFEAAPYFAVNVLAADQAPLVQHFAQRTLHKFDGIQATAGLGGVPLLDDVVARFECRTAGRYAGGDHVIYLGEVERYARFDKVPLVFVQGRYVPLTDAP